MYPSICNDARNHAHVARILMSSDDKVDSPAPSQARHSPMAYVTVSNTVTPAAPGDTGMSNDAESPSPP